MVEFRWIKMSLFLMLVLHFTAAVTRQSVSSFTVRVKHKVILPCDDMIEGQNKCVSTTWVFTGSRSRSAVELVTHGQIGENAQAKDRLSVTKNCSLIVKKVTVDDVGLYVCQQYKSRGAKSSSDSVVHLSVVSMTEHQNHDKVTLTCSVSTYEPCRHTVKWLYEGKEVKKDNRGVTTSQSLCSASVRAPSSHHIYKSEFEFVKCSVTDGDKEQQLFPFRLQSSGNKPGEEKTKNKKKPTTTATATNSPPNSDASTKPIDWRWLFIILAVVLVALLIIAAKVVRKKKADENKSRMGDDVGLASTQSAPGTSQSTAYPEDGVHYASVNYTDSKAKVRGKNDDKEEGGDVTYTMVKASSADPSCLYATIKK